MKKLLSILMCVCMLITAMPVTAFAATHSDHNDITFNQALSALGGTLSAGNYYLSKDITAASNITVDTGKTVNLCLNGKTLDLGSKYYIQVNGTLNIYDCQSNSGTIKGENATDYYIIRNTRVVTINGGTITYGKTGIGCCIMNYGDVIVTGGTVAGGRFGVENDGNLTISDGMISGDRGVINSGDLIVSGGTVSGTSMEGVENQSGGSVVVSGGVVSSGTSYYGILNYGTASISGGTVSGAYAGINNGRSDATLYLSGSPIIEGNENSHADLLASHGNIYATDTENSSSYSGGDLSIKISTPSNGLVVVNDVTDDNKNNFQLLNTGDYHLTLGTGDSSNDLILAEGSASGTCGENLTWTLDDTGLLTISGTGDMEEVSSAPWYDYSGTITDVVIEDGVTSIGNHAFFGCANLTAVTLPDTLTEIGAGAFELCTSLTDIALPDGLSSISESAFYYCDSLEQIMIPASVTSIGSCAFSGCDLLTDIYYRGSEEQWSEITIEASNEMLSTAKIHYNYVEPADVMFGSASLYDGYYTTDGVTASQTKPSDGIGYAYYNDGTLELNGIEVSGIPTIQVDPAIETLTVNVVRDSSIGVSGYFGIKSNGYILITGDGYLTVTSDERLESGDKRAAISADTITIDMTGGINVESKYTGTMGPSYGLYASSGIVIENGDIIAKGGAPDGYMYSAGIYTKDLTINGGTVNASSRALYSNGGPNTSYGIWAVNSCAVSNGTVTANGYNSGMQAANMTISGGTVIASATVNAFGTPDPALSESFDYMYRYSDSGEWLTDGTPDYSQQYVEIAPRHETESGEVTIWAENNKLYANLTLPEDYDNSADSGRYTVALRSAANSQNGSILYFLDPDRDYSITFLMWDFAADTAEVYTSETYDSISPVLVFAKTLDKGITCRTNQFAFPNSEASIQATIGDEKTTFEAEGLDLDNYSYELRNVTKGNIVEFNGTTAFAPSEDFDGDYVLRAARITESADEYLVEYSEDFAVEITVTGDSESGNTPGTEPDDAYFKVANYEDGWLIPADGFLNERFWMNPDVTTDNEYYFAFYDDNGVALNPIEVTVSGSAEISIERLDNSEIDANSESAAIYRLVAETCGDAVLTIQTAVETYTMEGTVEMPEVALYSLSNYSDDDSMLNAAVKEYDYNGDSPELYIVPKPGYTVSGVETTFASDGLDMELDETIGRYMVKVDSDTFNGGGLTVKVSYVSESNNNETGWQYVKVKIRDIRSQEEDGAATFKVAYSDQTDGLLYAPADDVCIRKTWFNVYPEKTVHGKSEYFIFYDADGNMLRPTSIASSDLDIVTFTKVDESEIADGSAVWKYVSKKLGQVTLTIETAEGTYEISGASVMPEVALYNTSIYDTTDESSMISKAVVEHEYDGTDPEIYALPRKEFAITDVAMVSSCAGISVIKDEATGVYQLKIDADTYAGEGDTSDSVILEAKFQYADGSNPDWQSWTRFGLYLTDLRSDNPDSIFNVNLSAETDAVVEDAVAVSVNVASDETKFASAEIEFSYDKELLRLDGIKSALGNVAFRDNNGRVSFADFGEDKDLGNNVYTINFTALKPGTAKVTLISAGFGSQDDAESMDLIPADCDKTPLNIKIEPQTYNVTLSDIYSGNATVKNGETYTFGKEAATGVHYNYAVPAATMGGRTVAVIDNGDGTWAIENVTGALVITGERSAKEYNVTLPDIFEGNSTVTYNTDYTFGKEGNTGTHYTYAKPTATMGGSNVTVIDNGNGTWTIKNVAGDLVISGERIAKSFAVTYTNAPAAEGGVTATYGTNYTFTLLDDLEPGTAPGYTYTMNSVTIDGENYSGYTTEGRSYTIPGSDIVGDVEIKIVKTDVEPNQFNISISGNGAGNGTLSAGVVNRGGSVTLTLVPETGYTYVVAMNGTEVTLVNNAYTVENINETVEFAITKSVDIAGVSVSEYVQLSGSKMWLVKNTAAKLDGKVYTYNDQNMFWSAQYNAYCTLVISEAEPVPVADEFGIVVGTATEVDYGKNVNKSERVDANDAQLVYNMYTTKYSSFTSNVTVENFLRADVNNDEKVNVGDAAAIVNAVLEL